MKPASSPPPPGWRPDKAGRDPRGRKQHTHGAEAMRRIALAASWGLPSAAAAAADLAAAGLPIGRSLAAAMIAEVADRRAPISTLIGGRVGRAILRSGEVPDWAPTLSTRALCEALLDQGHCDGLEMSIRAHLGPGQSPG